LMSFVQVLPPSTVFRGGSGLAVDIGPGPPVELIGLGDDDVEVARVDDEVADAPVGERPEPLPRLAAVDVL